MTMDISDVHELNSRIAKIVGVKLTAFADKRRFGLQSVIRAWHERLAARNVWGEAEWQKQNGPQGHLEHDTVDEMLWGQSGRETEYVSSMWEETGGYGFRTGNGKRREYA